MILHGVECERVQPSTPEQYVCAWRDRNTLAQALLALGVACKIVERPAIKGIKGLMSKPYALVQVLPADETR